VRSTAALTAFNFREMSGDSTITSGRPKTTPSDATRRSSARGRANNQLEGLLTLRATWPDQRLEKKGEVDWVLWPEVVEIDVRTDEVTNGGLHGVSTMSR
jgi:hypothetical protein